MIPLLLSIWIGAAAISIAEDEILTFEGKERVWQDATGKYEILASWKKYQDRTLTLETVDGRSIEISIDKISSADQTYAVKKIRAARRDATTSPTHDSSRESFASVRQPIASPELSEPLESREQELPSVKFEDSDNLYGVQWHPMEQAEQLAAQTDKPIMWFRVLGDLTGFM